MANIDERTGTVAVRAIYWHPDLERHPDIVVDRDADRADSQAALRIWQRLAREYGPEEWQQFLNSHAAPADWRGPEDVQHFLESVAMELPLPIIISDTAALADDARPGVDRDVTVAVLTPWSQDIGEANVVAGFDQADVERRLAEMILEHTGTGPVDGGAAYVPVLDDPVSVSRWLERAQQDLPQLPFTVQQKVLPGVSAVTPPPPVETPASGTSVWVGAVFADGRDGAEDDAEFLAAGSRADLERAMAVRLHAMITDVSDMPQARRFLDSHTTPDQWRDGGDVSEWLDSLYTASPGPAFTYQQIPLPPVGDADTLYVASLSDGNAFDAQLVADTDPQQLRWIVVDQLLERQDPATAQSMRAFLAEHGRPDAHTDLDGWIDAWQTQVGYPVVSIGTTPIPPAPTAPDAEGSQSVQVAAPIPVDPPGRVVPVNQLWSVVLESVDLGGDVPQTWVGTFEDTARAAVALLCDTVEPQQAEQFLADRPVDVGDMDSVEDWIDAFHRQHGGPEISLQPVFDASRLENLPTLPGLTAPTTPVTVSVADSAAAFARNTVGAAPLPAHLPTSGEVVVGVISWDDADQGSTLVGSSVEQVEAAAAQQLYRDLHGAAFDAQDLIGRIGDPTGLDPAGVKTWLAQITGVDGQPVVSIHEHVNAATLAIRLETAADNAVLGMLAPPPPKPTGQVMIDTGRAADWEVLNDGGIPDKLIAAIDPAPLASDYVRHQGVFDSDLFQEDLDEWMQQVLDITNGIANVLESQERLEQLESMRFTLARHVRAHPLPQEPNRVDYYPDGPKAHQGQSPDAAWLWDHTQWEKSFQAAALDTERVLAKMIYVTSPDNLRVGGPSDPMVGVAAQRVDALFDLVKPGPDGGPSLAETGLGAAERMRLEFMLRCGTVSTRVANPDATGTPRFDGLAVDAHRMLAPGLYRATLPDGSGDYRLIVGRSPVNGRTGVSAAYPLDEATATLLADTAKLRDQATQPRQVAEPDVTVTVGFKVTSPNGGRITPFPFTTPGQAPPPGMGL